MTPKTVLSAVTLAALVAASFSTIANAEAGKGDGERGAPMFNFEEVDTNGDGKVTKEEITAFHAAKMAAMDTDKDGNLSEAELIVAHAQRKSDREDKREAKMAKRMIEQRDANKDGVLSLAEMAPPADRSNKMFARADTDGDGTISKAEAEVMAEKMDERGGKGKGKHKDGKRDDG